MFWLTLLVFLIILSLLVFVHELGHFAVAKLSGVKVEEFAFGFPPRLVCIKRGETKYCLNAVPFGGYVKMLGEERSSDSPKSFNQKKARYRFAIVVAGVCMNLVLAGVLLSIGFMVGTSPIRLDTQKFGGQTVPEVTITQVVADSSAAKSDLKMGDIITGFASADEFAKFTRENISKSVTVTIRRENLTLTKTIQLSDNPDGPLGAGIADVTKVKLPFFKAIAAGFTDAYLTTIYIVGLLWGLLSHIFQPGQVAENVAGPVKIFNITGQAVKMGLAYIIQFAALLSINVALVNILPLPALDGGRAVIIFAEGIARRKIMRVEIENILHMIGFVIIITLLLAVTLREIIALL